MNGGRPAHFIHQDNPELMREILRQQILIDQSKGGLYDAKRPVPKTVHFTWGGRKPMRFHQMVCFLSAYYVLKPNKIIIWYSKYRPNGKWWEYIQKNITDFDDVVDWREKVDPDSIFGRAIYVPEHKSDIIRLQVLLENGGIYLDLDVLVLRPFDALLPYDTTMGLENEYGLCNGIIISKRNSTFLRLWWEEYKTFNDQQWSVHSVLLPFILAKAYPWMIHVEAKTLNRPNWYELNYLYGSEKYNWRKNFAIHLWFRKYDVEHDLDSIKKVDSTFGEIFRYILFGNPSIM
jgi:mannosyltransferase OCH1-like enzyme